MEKKFLDADGLKYLWQKIKATFMINPDEGSKNQVLTLKGDGSYGWADAQGGECSCEGLSYQDIDEAIADPAPL